MVLDSQENIILDSEEQETQITILEIDETTTTTTTSTRAPCIKEDNKDLDFTNLKTVQIFLNRYGFNAGDEDGLLGSKTINAIKNFQSFAGLKPDGSVGPKTINAMNNWTGCEKRSSEYVEIQEETNSTTTSTTTTSTTTTSTTTTTIATEVFNNTDIQYGYMPSVSLLNNEVISVFRGIENTASVCGTPYINNLDNNSINLYQNGNLQYSNVENDTFVLSDATAEITEIFSDKFKIKITGNGDQNFKFYFIKPFETTVTQLNPLTSQHLQVLRPQFLKRITSKMDIGSSALLKIVQGKSLNLVV